MRYDYTSSQWTRDESKINDLDYTQHIFGLYAGYVLKLKKFSVKSGLRAEGTINDGLFKSVKDTTFKNQRYGSFIYGSIRMLKQKLNVNTNIGITYSILESNDGRGLKNEGFSYNGSLNCRYTAWKNGTVSASGGLRSFPKKDNIFNDLR